MPFLRDLPPSVEYIIVVSYVDNKEIFCSGDTVEDVSLLARNSPKRHLKGLLNISKRQIDIWRERQLRNVSFKTFHWKWIIHHVLVFVILLLLGRWPYSISFCTIIFFAVTPHAHAYVMFVFQVSGVFENRQPSLCLKRS